MTDLEKLIEKIQKRHRFCKRGSSPTGGVVWMTTDLQKLIEKIQKRHTRKPNQYRCKKHGVVHITHPKYASCDSREGEKGKS